jgi:hypothetical protein
LAETSHRFEEPNSRPGFITGGNSQVRVPFGEFGQQPCQLGQPNVAQQTTDSRVSLEPRAERIYQWLVRHSAAGFERPTSKNVGALRSRPCQELCRQSRLPNAGLPLQQDDHGSPGASGGERLGQLRKFGGAPDERNMKLGLPSSD